MQCYIVGFFFFIYTTGIAAWGLWVLVSQCAGSRFRSVWSTSVKGSWGQDGIRIHYHIVFCFDNLMWGLHTTENPIGMPLHFAANWKAVEMCNNGRLGAMRTANFGGSVSAQGWKIGSRTERSKAWLLSVSIFVCIMYSMYVCHIYRDWFLLPKYDDCEY